MEKGKMGGAMEKGKMEAAPWKRARWNDLST